MDVRPRRKNSSRLLSVFRLLVTCHAAYPMPGVHAMTIRVGGPVLGWWILVASAIANVGQFEAEMSSDAFQLQVHRRPPCSKSYVNGQLLLEGATSRPAPSRGSTGLAGVSTRPRVAPPVNQLPHASLPYLLPVRCHTWVCGRDAKTILLFELGLRRVLCVLQGMAASGMLPARLAYKSRHGSPPLCIALSAIGMLLCFASSFMEVRPQALPVDVCVSRMNRAT